MTEGISERERERVWFYTDFAGRICMVIICGSRERVRCRNDAARRGGGGADRGGHGEEEERAMVVATIGAARFVYRG